MSKVEQKILVDKGTLEHLIEFLRDAVKSKASDENIQEQAWEILDPDYRRSTDQAFKEMKEGKTQTFKDAEEMIADLHSSR